MPSPCAPGIRDCMQVSLPLTPAIAKQQNRVCKRTIPKHNPKKDWRVLADDRSVSWVGRSYCPLLVLIFERRGSPCDGRVSWAFLCMLLRDD
jgi:hypothetical protein